MDNGEDADKTGKPGKYSDNLLRLVEETDKDGGLSYCVECCKTGDLLYSSNSKPQAFSFAEGYRARDGEGDSKTRKAKTEDNNDNGDNGDKPKPVQNIDPVKVVQRKRVAI